MSVMFLVNGTHTSSHVYRVGDDVIIDCHVIAVPTPTVTWSHGQQLITPSARRSVGLGYILQETHEKTCINDTLAVCGGIF